MKMIVKPCATLFFEDTLVSIAMFDGNEPSQKADTEAAMLEIAFIRQLFSQ
jgi:hypothetical protein